jgi:hypothetical protein
MIRFVLMWRLMSHISLLSRTAMHCKGDDVLRDEYFTDRGWIVLRFSERTITF